MRRIRFRHVRPHAAVAPSHPSNASEVLGPPNQFLIRAGSHLTPNQLSDIHLLWHSLNIEAIADLVVLRKRSALCLEPIDYSSLQDHVVVSIVRDSIGAALNRKIMGRLCLSEHLATLIALGSVDAGR